MPEYVNMSQYVNKSRSKTVLVSGVRWCGNRRASHLLHLSWGLIYSLAGGVQFTAGIYFMMALPIFQLGSNIWTGAWVSRS